MLPVVRRPWHCMGGESFAAAACIPSSACVVIVLTLRYMCMQARCPAHDWQVAHTHHLWHVQKHNVCRCVYAVLMTVHFICKSLCAHDLEMCEAICHSPCVFCMDDLHVTHACCMSYLCKSHLSMCVCACRACVCVHVSVSVRDSTLSGFVCKTCMPSLCGACAGMLVFECCMLLPAQCHRVCHCSAYLF